MQIIEIQVGDHDLIRYPDFSDEIRRGSEYLDEVKPSWPFDIKVSRLDISSSENCVLGQVFGPNYTIPTASAQIFGFELQQPNEYHWAALTAQWRKFITSRLS